MQFETRPSFFLLRKDGTNELGSSFPATAVMGPKLTHALIVRYPDRTRQVKLSGSTLADAIEFARKAIGCDGAEGVRIGRAVGTFGRPLLYEEAAVIGADSADLDDIFRLPLVAEEKDGKKVRHAEVRISKAVTGREIEGLASTPNVDRDFDVVLPKAFEGSLDAYRKNPVLLLNHDFGRPIGNVTLIEARDEGLFVRARIDDLEVQRWVKNGNVRAFSVQFLIEDAEFKDGPDGGAVRVVTKGELLEVSVVTVQSNRESLFEVVKSFEAGAKRRGEKGPSAFISDVRESLGDLCCAVKSPRLVEFRLFPTAKGLDQVDLDAAAIRQKHGSESARLSAAFESDGGLLFPHHGVSGDALQTDPLAVRVSLAQLVANTFPSLGNEDRKGCWAHLARHAQEWGEEAPEIPAEPAPGDFRGIVEKGGESVVRLDFDSEVFDADECESWAKEHGFRANESGPRRTVDDPGLVLGEVKAIELAEGVTGYFVATASRKDEKMGDESGNGESGQRSDGSRQGEHGDDERAADGSQSDAEGNGGSGQDRSRYSAEELGRAAGAAVAEANRHSAESAGAGDEGEAYSEIDLSPETVETLDLIEQGHGDKLRPEVVEAAHREIGAAVDSVLEDSPDGSQDSD